LPANHIADEEGWHYGRASQWLLVQKPVVDKARLGY
jgi:hypothetical protein